MPILVERNKGAGHCLLFGIPADNAWGDWAIHSLFLPLVHQVAGYASGRLAGAGRVREAASRLENGRSARRDHGKRPGAGQECRRGGVGR